ncbi:MAG: AhpC/TSA family protein [Lutibacter sp.]|nr:AhpC/TSA family protein [Lutibacter sp.]
MKITLLTIVMVLSIGKVTSQINNEHLKVGELAPKIVGINQFNLEIDSDNILKENKILLLFYRGNWCPHCNKHLASLQNNIENFTKKGVYVIVVTPEKVDKIKETSKKFNATFSIIHDSDNKIMNEYKVAFDVNKDNVPNYFEFTLKRVREYNEIENNVLPVPATYLIDKNHKISYVHYDSDYSKRSDFTEILEKIK